MSEDLGPIVTEVPVNNVPTRAALEKQLTAMIIQRSGLRDQIETIEKQMPALSSMIQLLQLQEQAAEAVHAD